MCHVCTMFSEAELEGYQVKFQLCASQVQCDHKGLGVHSPNHQRLCLSTICEAVLQFLWTSPWLAQFYGGHHFSLAPTPLFLFLFVQKACCEISNAILDFLSIDHCGASALHCFEAWSATPNIVRLSIGALCHCGSTWCLHVLRCPIPRRNKRQQNFEVSHLDPCDSSLHVSFSLLPGYVTCIAK
jgi:hypothetical protein